MILIVSNSTDDHVPRVLRVLGEMRRRVIRLDTDRFPEQVSVGFRVRSGTATVTFRSEGREVRGEEISAIWYRRPEAPAAPSRVVESKARQFAEAELAASLNGALRALGCFWLNHPEAIRTAGHKIAQLGAANALGFDVPETCVSSDPDEIRAFYQRCGGRMIAKVVAQGPPRAARPEEQYVIFTSVVEPEDLASDEALAACPAIYQEYVAKAYELRVTVVGDDVFACEIHSQASLETRIDWRRYDLPNTPHRAATLPSDTLDRCLALTRHFGLSFSAMDLVVTPQGRIVFLELNPNGQWGWIEELTGLPISRAIAERLATGRC